MAKKEEKAQVAAKITVANLAKEFGVRSKLLVEEALKLNIVVKSHSSVLTQGQADRLRFKLGGGKLLEKVEEKKPRPRTSAKKAQPAEASPANEALIGEAPQSLEVEAASPKPKRPKAKEKTAALTPSISPVAPAPLLTSPEVAPVLLGFDDGLGMMDAAPPTLGSFPQPLVAPTDVSVETTSGATEMAGDVPDAADVVAETVLPELKAAAEEPRMSAPTEAEASSSEVPPVEAESATAPEEQKEVRVLRAGPEIAPPLTPQKTKSEETRFGVVISAEKAEEIHGPTLSRRRGPAPRTVESKAVESFTPQVSYPTLPKSPPVAESDDDGGRRKGGGRRGGSSPAAGSAGRGRDPRRGRMQGRSGGEDSDTGRRYKKKRAAMPAPKLAVKREGPVTVTSPITIRVLSEGLGIKSSELIAKFLLQGRAVNINSVLPDDEAQLLSLEFGREIIIKKARDLEEEMLAKAETPDRPEDLQPRSPVVTVMGHVDHGKTTLLDKIRNAHVAAGEFGGITQHISAYKVRLPNGSVVFLDTPGHKAFTEMRARGANVTDIVVLVVAADDGVMPQTLEALSHARAAGRKIVVAINKCDRPDANVDRTKAAMAAHGLYVEGYGGDTGCVELSALTGKGVNELLDRILLESEMLELRANFNKPARGTVVEAEKDQGRGIEATVLVEDGTLRVGDILICGHAYGRVRRMQNDVGAAIKEAGPASPVLVTGLNEVPLAGERFHVVQHIEDAAQMAEKRLSDMRREGLISRRTVTLENLHSMIAEGELASLNLVLKVDVMGSLAPLERALTDLSTGEARINVVHSGVGAANETDVLLAEASKGVVVAFNIPVDPSARTLAEQRRVQLREYNVIYDAVSEMRAALEGLLKPIETEVVLGKCEVRQLFSISRYGTIAGCFVLDGVVRRTAGVHLIRDGQRVWTGRTASLQRFKDDVREVREGFECGLRLEGRDDLKPGDIVEFFTVEQVARKLEDTGKATAKT